MAWAWWLGMCGSIYFCQAAGPRSCGCTVVVGSLSLELGARVDCLMSVPLPHNCLPLVSCCVRRGMLVWLGSEMRDRDSSRACYVLWRLSPVNALSPDSISHQQEVRGVPCPNVPCWGRICLRHLSGEESK